MGIDIGAVSQIGRAMAVHDRNENNRRHPGSRDSKHETWEQTNRRAAQNTLALLLLLGVLTCGAKLLVFCGRASLKLLGRKFGMAFNSAVIFLFVLMVGAHWYNMVTFSGGLAVRDFAAKTLLVLVVFWVVAAMLKITQTAWLRARSRFGKFVSVLLNAPVFVADLVVVVAFVTVCTSIFVDENSEQAVENQRVISHTVNEDFENDDQNKITENSEGFEHVNCVKTHARAGGGDVAERKHRIGVASQEVKEKASGREVEINEDKVAGQTDNAVEEQAKENIDGIQHSEVAENFELCVELKQREMARVAEVADGYLKRLNRHTSAIDPDFEAVHKIEYARDRIGPAGIVCIGMSYDEAKVRLTEAADEAIREMEKSFQKAKGGKR